VPLPGADDHELRTPLNAVIGFLRSHPAGNLRSGRAAALPRICRPDQQQRKLLLELINDVLDLSKIEGRPDGA